MSNTFGKEKSVFTEEYQEFLQNWVLTCQIGKIGKLEGNSITIEYTNFLKSGLFLNGPTSISFDSCDEVLTLFKVRINRFLSSLVWYLCLGRQSFYFNFNSSLDACTLRGTEARSILDLKVAFKIADSASNMSCRIKMWSCGQNALNLWII